MGNRATGDGWALAVPHGPQFRYLVEPAAAPWYLQPLADQTPGRRSRSIIAAAGILGAIFASWLVVGGLDIVAISASASAGTIAWVYGEIISEDGLLNDDQSG